MQNQIDDNITSWVALLTEGVDRNFVAGRELPFQLESPSSRRAWIEIAQVADLPFSMMSPSSRRAWIEIWISLVVWVVRFRVALLTEGVDRNFVVGNGDLFGTGRPPHGGRG